MTGTQTTLLWIYAGIIAIWPIRLIVLTVILRRQEFLTPRSPRYEQPDPPQVLAIVPAKDEEANLADCLASVSRQTYPNLEILVVDDRSTDRTGEIARQFAAEDSRIPSAHDRPSPGRMDRQDPCLALRGHRITRRVALVPGRRHVTRPRSALHLDGIRPDSRCSPGEPAPRAALRDVLGAGRAAARRHHLDAVIPAPPGP